MYVLSTTAPARCRAVTETKEQGTRARSPWPGFTTHAAVIPLQDKAAERPERGKSISPAVVALKSAYLESISAQVGTTENRR